MPWLPSMGPRFSLLLAAPLLLAVPALAQQENDAEPVFNLPRTQPPANPTQQGPELDVFRGAPTTVTPPPVVAPTVQPPPPVIPAPQPAPEQPQRRPATPSAPAQPAPRVESSPPAASTPPQQAVQPGPAPIAPPAIEAQSAPPRPNPPPPVPVTPLAPAEESGSSWPWIAAAVGLAILAGAFLWLRRRKPQEVDRAFDEAQAASAPTTRPMQPEPAPAPPSPAKPAAPPVSTDRPWLNLAMEVQAARLTLMGATIAYTVTVHNRGTRAAEDILIRSLIANAGAQQQAQFQQFFAGENGLPVHSAVSIAPGETQKLTGEMRLNAQEIAAIPVGQRALLVPLIAFDAQYRWTDEAGETQGTGRTGRAFIVGQEQSPPVERLAPFRLDLGPRQYRTPGSRATALALES